MRKTAETVKISARLSADLWRQVQHRAIDEDREIQELLALALALYLKQPPKRRGGQSR